MTLWDFKAGFYDRLRLLPPLKNIYLAELENLTTLIPQQSFQKQLDLGTGPGFTFSKLRRAEWCCISDLSLDMVKQAKASEKRPGACLNANSALPFRDTSFDFITAVGLLEYLSDPTVFFDETFRIARPDGFMLFTSSPRSWKTALRRLSGEKVRGMEKQDVQKMIERCGWEICEMQESWMQMQWLARKNGG